MVNITIDLADMVLKNIVIDIMLSKEYIDEDNSRKRISV